MDRSDVSSALLCTLCGEAFTLPGAEAEGNLPRVLLCTHMYCTSCLRLIQCGRVIKCPECEIETALSEDGVDSLQEDDRTTGLIYTTKMNKLKRSKNRRMRSRLSRDDENIEDLVQPANINTIERSVDEALAQAAENLAQLEHIHETLSAGLTEQINRERVHLEMEIKQVVDKALHSVHTWRDLQMIQLTKLDSEFSTSKAEVSRVQERLKAVEIATQRVREVCQVPFLEQYCTLDEALDTLKTPVDKQSFDMQCITMTSKISYVFQAEALNDSLTLSLKREDKDLKQLSKSPPKGYQSSSSKRTPSWQHAEDKNSNYIPTKSNVSSKPQKESQDSPKANRPSPQSSSPRPCRRSSRSRHSMGSDLGSPDVIIEEFLDEKQEKAVPPTGPELARDKRKIQRGRKQPFFGNKRNVTRWVMVTHIVNPSHFYVHYVAEKKESEILSKKINTLCYRDDCLYTCSDTVETGSMIFVKWKEGLWCRANVVEVFQSGSAEFVKDCPVTQLASLRVFFPDNGLTKSIYIQSEERTMESLLKAVHNHFRKVGESAVEIRQFTPQAIRCSLKDLVPYDLTKGWCKEAQVEFFSIVGSSAVEMRPLGQDKDSLLVDLRKVPMGQSSDKPISVREYLVFIEVARFYSPVSLGRMPLLYQPPVYPKTNTDVTAVVSHINNPDDFYIQLADNMKFLLLSDKLQECYNATAISGEDLNIYCPVVGQACVARYDKLWYRAIVVGLPEGRKVEVQYVDFGNKKILSVRDLRKIKGEFFGLPSMAIHCSLSEVIPLNGESWSESCTNRFISLAHQKWVTIVAAGTEHMTVPLPVKLFERSLNGPLANFAELLIKEQLACFKEGIKSNHSLDDDSVIWDPPLELSSGLEGLNTLDQNNLGVQDEEPLELQPQLRLPAELKDMKVRVSHVNSPSSFYVLFTQNDLQLKRICEQVKQQCGLMEPQDVEWKVDMYCAAHIKGVWERGRICSVITSSNIAEVMRCDHGKTLKLHVSNLRPMPSSLIGSLALECTLADIRPAGGGATWTATACELISHYLTGASAVVTIKELTDERPVPVTLFCSNERGQMVSIADFLSSEGVALKDRKPRDTIIEKPSSHIPTAVHPKPVPQIIMSAEEVTTQMYHPPDMPCLGYIQITVSAIGEDGLIYARTHNAECQLELLRKRIQQILKTLPNPKPYKWKSIQGCALIGADMLWYRGQLLEVLRGHVKVQYVDYGLVETIPVVHVYPKLLCDDVPQLCLPCQLYGIKPVGGKWQQDAVALMREMLLNRCVDMQVVELPTDPRGPLTVEFFLDGISLNRILCHHQHASMDQIVSLQGHRVTSSPPLLDEWDIDTEGLRSPEEPILGPFVYPDLPQVGQQFQVRVKHLWTPNELFLWPLEETSNVEVDGETLVEALTTINENISSLPYLTDFPPGSLCLAEYSDGKYYRAKLIKITSVEPVLILVQHVDFGSHDTLPTSKLRQMPARLLQFAVQVFKVKVAGFKAPSVNTREDVLSYSPLWSVTAVKDMIDLLHGNITASVVATEPELTVLLYNEDGELVHLPLVHSGLAELE